MGDGIEVLFLLEEHLATIHLPVVPKVALNLLLEVQIDVLARAVWLVLDSADQVEPLLEFLVLVARVLSLHRDDDVLELVHQDGEEGDAEDLNDAAENLLHDRNWVEITVTDCR